MDLVKTYYNRNRQTQFCRLILSINERKNYMFSTKRSLRYNLIYWIFLIVFAGFAVFGLFQYVRAEKSERSAQNSYSRAFYELSDSMREIDALLEKIMLSQNPTQISALASDIYAQTESAKASLSQLPFESGTLVSASKFLSQAGDYTAYISAKVTDSGEITNEEFNNLLSLAKHAEIMDDALEEYTEHLSEGEFSSDKPKSNSVYADGEGYNFLDGMAKIENRVPLYFDAVNECGLGMAGLNFPGNAHYFPFTEGKQNVAPFELIPYILGQCQSIPDARNLLKDINLLHLPFSEQLPLTPLHWFLADAKESVTIESTADGLHVYENPVGVLTNNPSFPIQMFTLNHCINLTSEPPVNRWTPELPLDIYSNGMGSLGLPGDLSSNSRFLRAVFTKHHSISGNSETECVNQFFHILGAVVQQRGCVKLGSDYERTLYTSCCTMDTGVYYYTTYENRRITAVDIHSEFLDGNTLISYPLITAPQILRQNEHS